MDTTTLTADHMAAIEKIALDHLFVETLETRRSDSLDFHDCSVWGIKSALIAAFEAGRQSAQATAKPKKPAPLTQRAGSPSELVDKIYKAEGWVAAPGERRIERVKEVYSLQANKGCTIWRATRLHSAEA